MKAACKIDQATIEQKTVSVSLRFEHQISLDIDMSTTAGQIVFRKICDAVGAVRINDLSEIEGKTITVEIEPNKVKAVDGLMQPTPLFFVKKIC
jgi:RNA recognition motif-containing protein